MNNRINSVLRFIRANQLKFVILLLVAAVLDYAARFPYLNVLLVFPYPWRLSFILWVVTALLFELSERFSFGTALVLLCFIMTASVFGKGNLVEALGNGVYGLLLLGIVQIIVKAYYRPRV